MNSELASAGFVEAMERERVVRSVSYAPILEKICDFELMPMTLAHWSILRLSNSPMLPPFGTPDAAQLSAFLWVLNPGFKAGDFQARDGFLKRCRVFSIPGKPILFRRRWERRAACALAYQVRLVCAGREFVAETFQDAQRGSPGAEDVEFYSDESAITSRLGRNYGWSEEAILKMPLKRIFQHLKEIREFNAAQSGRPALLENRSEDVIDALLLKANSKN